MSQWLFHNIYPPVGALQENSSEYDITTGRVQINSGFEGNRFKMSQSDTHPSCCVATACSPRRNE